MAISFDCACGKALRARDDLAGRRAKCTGCGAIVSIPAADMVVVAAILDDEAPGHPPTPTAPAPRVVTAIIDDVPRPRRPTRAVPSPAPVPIPAPDASSPYFDDDEEDAPAPASTSVAAPAPVADDEEIYPMRLGPTSTYRPTPATTDTADSAGSSSRKRGTARGGKPTILEYAYLLLGLALIPSLAWTLGRDGDVEIQERFARTIAQAPAAEQERIKTAMAQDSMDLDEALAILPGNRLVGAHLPRDTSTHWAYAGLATAGFLGVLSLCFSVERAHPVHLLGVGLFTATFGILFLLLVQFCAMIRLGSIRAGGFGLIVLLLMWFIGWSYNSANDPESGFWLSAFGFTFGVGLCEEFAKAIPMFFWFRRFSEVGWRGACLWGLASGVGFGISEGVMYSASHYNGIHGADIYLVRFVSCVALHAMWAGSVGIAIARHIDEYESIHDAAGFGLFAIRVMIVPMVLHGFYDTLLKKEMAGWAFLVALLSFGWLAWHIEIARQARAAGGRPKVSRPIGAYY